MWRYFKTLAFKTMGTAYKSADRQSYTIYFPFFFTYEIIQMYILIIHTLQFSTFISFTSSNYKQLRNNLCTKSFQKSAILSTFLRDLSSLHVLWKHISSNSPSYSYFQGIQFGFHRNTTLYFHTSIFINLSDISIN